MIFFFMKRPYLFTPRSVPIALPCNPLLLLVGADGRGLTATDHLLLLNLPPILGGESLSLARGLLLLELPLELRRARVRTL